MKPTDLPLHDACQWPLRMTKAEVAHVTRWSLRMLRDKVCKEQFPQPTGGFFVRAEIVAFIQGGSRKFDRQHERRESRLKRR